MKIYGIKTCGSVQKAIKFCETNGVDFEFIDFRKTPLEDSLIDFFASKVDINLLFNNKGTKYKTLGLKELNLDNDGKLAWLKKDNMLLKRPVINYNTNKIICGFDDTLYMSELINK